MGTASCYGTADMARRTSPVPLLQFAKREHQRASLRLFAHVQPCSPSLWTCTVLSSGSRTRPAAPPSSRSSSEYTLLRKSREPPR